MESEGGNGPYTYPSGKTTLYYYGLNEAGDAHLFSPEEFPERSDFIGSSDYTGSNLVYWVNEDSNDLPNSPEIYEDNAMPTYKGATPTKPADADYTYVFNGWDPTIVPVTHTTTIYTATYLAISKALTVTWKNDDGTVLRTDAVENDDIPFYTGATPTKEGYSRFTYTHSGWTDGTTEYSLTDTLPVVTGDITYTATYTERSKLFVGHSLTLAGDIGVNFFLDVTESEVTTGEGVLVKFEWNVEGNIKRSEYKLNTDPDNKITFKGKVYYMATCWVAAAEMTYTIHAVALINNVEQDETDNYCVRDYGMQILNSPTGTFEKHDKLVDLVKAMLDYGAKAQIRFDRKTDDLANKDVEGYSMVTIDKDTIPTKKDDMTAGLADLGLEYYGTSIVYLSETTIRHYYTIKDRSKLADVIAAAEDSGFVYSERSGFACFDKKNISARNLSTAYSIKLSSSNSYRYSVLDYSKLVLTGSTVERERNLAMATYWYNQYAHAYFD